MDKNSTLYTLLFAAVVCLVCGVAVASSAVGLRERQDENKAVDRQAKVLAAAGLLPEGKVAAQEITRLYDAHVRPRVIDLESGQEADGVEAAQFDVQAAMKDPAQSAPAPANPAQVQRLPKHSLLYEIHQRDELSALVLPVQGKGLWSTLYGYLALYPDADTIKGLIFYQHGETPGLGGEVDNPRWQGLWDGRKAYKDGTPAIEVIKGQAGPPEESPYQVDGLSGATITARGVTHLTRFWLGEQGYGPTLARYRQAAPAGKPAATEQ